MRIASLIITLNVCISIANCQIDRSLSYEMYSINGEEEIQRYFNQDLELEDREPSSCVKVEISDTSIVVNTLTSTGNHFIETQTDSTVSISLNSIEMSFNSLYPKGLEYEYVKHSKETNRIILGEVCYPVFLTWSNTEVTIWLPKDKKDLIDVSNFGKLYNRYVYKGQIIYAYSLYYVNIYNSKNSVLRHFQLSELSSN